MSGEEEEKNNLSAQEAAVIELLKQQKLEQDKDGSHKKHKFWDTQVGGL